MAQDRFFFWRGYWDALKCLPTAKRGELVTAMCEYAFDDIEPTFDDEMLTLAWCLVRDQISESVRIGREAAKCGKRGGRPKKNNTKRMPFRDPLTHPKRDPKRDPETLPERVPESVRYGKVPSASRTSAGADALALDESEQWYVDNGLEVPYVPDESQGT